MNTINQQRLVITSGWLVIIVICLAYIITNLNVVANMQQFMPSESNNKRLKILLHETQKGLATNLILVQLDGASAKNLANTSRQLKRSLEKYPNSFKSIINGEKDFDLKKYQRLLQQRYLLTSDNDFSVAALRKSFKELLTLFRTGISGDTIQYLLLDPQRAFTKYLLAQTGESQPEKYNGVWFVADKSKALLMVQLNSSDYDLDVQQNAINLIKSTVKQLDKSGKVNLLLSGPGTIAVAIRDSIQKITKLVTWVLIAVVLLLFWFAYRSLRLAFMASLPLVTSIIVAIAVTQLLFGELHGVVLAFGITMLGVCLDYPLHLFSHLNKNESATQSLKRIWPTLRLGVISSVLAYVALMGTGFSGLTQLAVFSAIGLLVALAVTRLLLPVWVSASWMCKKEFPVARPFSNPVKVMASAALIIIPLSILLLQDNIWSNDVSQISPIPLELRLADRQLREELHAVNVSHLFIVDAPSMQSVLDNTQKVKQQLSQAINDNIITGIITAIDLLPSVSQQKRNQAALPNKTLLQNNVSLALQGLAFKKSSFEGFIENVLSSKTRAPVSFDDILASPLAARLQSMLFQQDNVWYSIVRVTGVKNDVIFTDWVNSRAVLKSDYFSIRASTTVLMNSYLQSAWLRLLAVLGLLTLVILWQARRRSAAIWLFVPIAAGVLLSLTVQVLLGHLINIFHVLSLLLVIGMGLDYSLFFNREWSIESQLQDRTHAIIISAVTTIVVFATLGLSDIPILAAMGQTVAVGIITSFFVAQRIAVPTALVKD